jgi:diaminopimelate decarboxylase
MATSWLDPETSAALAGIAGRHGTPSFVYFPAPMRDRLARVTSAFGDRFEVSFAMKCNPNVGLLRALRGSLTLLDASSAGEVARGVAAGYDAAAIAFSGPAKRDVEIEYAVGIGCGTIVCESEAQVDAVDRIARRQGRRQPILIRINPIRVPRKFGLHMGGRPSQFGIDEEQVGAVLDALPGKSGVDCVGLHVYSAGNSLDEEAIAENVDNIATLFAQLTADHGLRPAHLVFGSGFGIPYFAEDQELDLARLGAAINPVLDRLRSQPGCSDARLILEMGRWLVGPDGYLLTSVVDAKTSRGTEIRLCDAGFNNHLSACGMMGTVMRRNWRFANLSRAGQDPSRKYLLVGPLCASFDVLGTNVDLPETLAGDVIAVGSSGAYGLTASPTRFISHPEPREWLMDDETITEVTESTLNHAFETVAGTPAPHHATS